MTLKDGNKATRINVEEGLMAKFNIKPLEIQRQKVRYQLTTRNDVLYEAKNDDMAAANGHGPGPRGEMTLANLFRELENIKKDRPIISYAVNQTSLEQIFLTMARDDIEKNKDENEELARRSVIETREGINDNRYNNNNDDTAAIGNGSNSPVYQ